MVDGLYVMDDIGESFVRNHMLENRNHSSNKVHAHKCWKYTHGEEIISVCWQILVVMGEEGTSDHDGLDTGHF